MFEDENRDHLWLRTENHSISYVFCQDNGELVSYYFKMSNILFLPPYYSETLGRFKYDVSGLFNFTSKYRLYNLRYGT
jgi:hypothetical protein